MLIATCRVQCRLRNWTDHDFHPCEEFSTGGGKAAREEHPKASDDSFLHDAVTVEATNSEAEVVPMTDLRRSTPARDARQKRRAAISESKANIALPETTADAPPADADLLPRRSHAKSVQERTPGDPPKWAVNSCGPPGETCGNKPGGGVKREIEDKDEVVSLPASVVAKPDTVLAERVASQRPAFTFKPTLCTVAGMPCGVGRIRKRETEGEQTAATEQDDLPKNNGTPRSDVGDADSGVPKPALCGYPGINCATSTGPAVERRDSSVEIGAFVDDDGHVFEVEIDSSWNA